MFVFLRWNQKSRNAEYKTDRPIIEKKQPFQQKGKLKRNALISGSCRVYVYLTTFLQPETFPNKFSISFGGKTIN